MYVCVLVCCAVPCRERACDRPIPVKGKWSENLKVRDQIGALSVGNIKIDFKEIGYEDMKWIQPAHD
jgi:hypothetical protein